MTEPAATYKTRRQPAGGKLAAIAAVSILAIGAAILAFALGWAKADTPAALDPTTQAKCDTIKQRHTAWTLTNSQLQALAFSYDPATAGPKLDNIKAEGDGYYKTLDGYSDPAMGALTLAVATYNVEVGFVSLENQLQRNVAQDTYKKATASATEVESAYQAFISETCTAK